MKRFLWLGIMLVVLFPVVCSAVGTTDSIVYYYCSADPGGSHAEDRILALKYQKNVVRLYFWGTTDEFVSAREGYYPGFFVAEARNLKIEKDRMRFDLSLDGNQLFDDAVPVTVWRTDAVHGIDSYLHAQAYKQMSASYDAVLKDGNIYLSNPNYLSEKVFVRKSLSKLEQIDRRARWKKTEQKKDTLFFQNDTISQTLIWEKVNDLKILFWLSSKDARQQKACIFQGEAERPDGWDFGDETDMDADGSIYPAAEYWYHGKDVEFSVRISHDLQKARIYSLKNPSLPFIYTLRKKSAPACPPASALTLYESVRNVAYQHYKSGFEPWKGKEFSLDLFGKGGINEKNVASGFDTLFLPKMIDEDYEGATIVHLKGSVIPYKNLDVAFFRIDCELNHKGLNFTDYVMATYTPTGFPLDYRVLGREGFAPCMGDVYYFRMKGDLDSMVFMSDQASCLNEQQLADFGNQDFEVRRMRYEIRGDGRITGVQIQKAWKEIKERDAEDVSVSFADYLSLFRPFGDRDDVKNLFSLESRKKATTAGGGPSSTSEEPLSVGYVRRFIPDGIDPTCEKRTIGWYPLYTFRAGKYVVCSLYKFGDVPKSYNYPNREGLLVVYTPEGKIVDACLLARDGDLWSYNIGKGTVRPFCLQVRQNVSTNSESSHNGVVSEYTLDQDGHIHARLIQVD